MQRLIPFSWLAFVLPACAPPADREAEAASVDTVAVTTSVNDLWQRWTAAAIAGDAAGFAGLVTDSARGDFRGYPPMIGRQAWRTTMESIFPTTRITAMTVTPDQTVPVSNELAYQNGNYLETLTRGPETHTEYGRYAAALRREADGQWRVSYLIGFADSIVPQRR